MVGIRTRAAVIRSQQITGLSSEVIAELVAEIGPLWHERHQAALASRPRRRAVGAGAKHKLVFVDRLLATLIHLRHGVTHDVLACWFGVNRSTITRAIGEVRPLLAQRGCTIAPGLRLRTLAEVVDHLGENQKTGIIDGTEIRVRRPAAGRKDRDKFISGKNKQNAVKSMVFTDEDGRLLYCSPAEPASCADITHARKLGLVRVLSNGPAVEILADAGYQGLGAQTGGRVITPPHRKFKKNAPDWYEEIHEQRRKAHSSRRIRVEHGIAHLKNWRALARHHGRREHMSDIIQAVAALLSHQHAVSPSYPMNECKYRTSSYPSTCQRQPCTSSLGPRLLKTNTEPPLALMPVMVSGVPRQEGDERDVGDGGGGHEPEVRIAASSRRQFADEGAEISHGKHDARAGPG
ncbi:transposase family protein [Streptomyces griseofuscus]|uniref:transposase family protein n=1 Tax=Streptomyces griseofuscus TaxID=146922 RepID=UPI0037FE55FC